MKASCGPTAATDECVTCCMWVAADMLLLLACVLPLLLLLVLLLLQIWHCHVLVRPRRSPAAAAE